MKNLNSKLTLILTCTILSITAIAQNTPCDCAHRWAGGGAWDASDTDINIPLCSNDNGGDGINDCSNAPEPLGVIRCGSSAETENQLQANNICNYASSQFEILLGTDCFQPQEGSINEGRTGIVTTPQNAQEVIWLNFDVRAHAGTYQYQITPSNGELGWALYYSNTHQNNINSNGLSGNCNDLAYYDCGISSTGWVTFTVPTFNQPTNLYLAIWRNNGNDYSNQNITFKARYGCGDASDVVLCLLDSNDPITQCNNDGTYTLTIPIEGANGEYLAIDNNNNTIFSNPICLTNLGSDPAIINGNIELVYPQGIDYNVSINEVSPSTIIGCAEPDNSSECSLSIVGIAPSCCSPPSIVCPNDLTIDCNDSLDPSINPNLSVATSNGGCGTVGISFNDTFSPLCGLTGAIERTWTAIDGNGNQISCLQNIIVQDTTNLHSMKHYLLILP